jgi:hypothetical protein
MTRESFFQRLSASGPATFFVGGFLLMIVSITGIALVCLIIAAFNARFILDTAPSLDQGFARMIANNKNFFSLRYLALISFLMLCGCIESFFLAGLHRVVLRVVAAGKETPQKKRRRSLLMSARITCIGAVLVGLLAAFNVTNFRMPNCYENFFNEWLLFAYFSTIVCGPLGAILGPIIFGRPSAEDKRARRWQY